MIDSPHVTKTTTQLTAVIHLQIARHEIQRVMGPGLRELMSTVADQGIKPTGPWFVHHLTRPADGWDFEISVPVSEPVVASGRVKPSQWPAMTVARTVYEGPYEGLAGAWANSWTGLPPTDIRPPKTCTKAT
jgi:effector-binding domain-containing protein